MIVDGLIVIKIVEFIWNLGDFVVIFGVNLVKVINLVFSIDGSLKVYYDLILNKFIIVF